MKLVAVFVVVIATSLWSATTFATEDEPSFGGKPSGILICEGVYQHDNQLQWKTVKFSFEVLNEGSLFKAESWYVGIDGLDYGSGGYMFNSTKIMVHAPKECLAGDESLAYSGCKFVGIIDRIDGSFGFHRGDHMDDPDNAFFWSQTKDDKICRKVEAAF